MFDEFLIKTNDVNLINFTNTSVTKDEKYFSTDLK